MKKFSYLFYKETTQDMICKKLILVNDKNIIQHVIKSFFFFFLTSFIAAQNYK